MKHIILKLIRAYQVLSRSGAFSPVFTSAYSGCRSWPTCSDYACAAIERDGVIRGGQKALVRLLRCNPLSSPR